MKKQNNIYRIVIELNRGLNIDSAKDVLDEIRSKMLPDYEDCFSEESMKIEKFDEMTAESICRKCITQEYKYSLKLIPTSREDHKEWMPKYVPQIKKLCGNGHFIKFEEQTKEVVDLVNHNLSEMEAMI